MSQLALKDGVRIPVHRLWPRGLSKQRAAINQWMKDISPSTKLRQWFGHDPSRWDEFRRRYVIAAHQHPELLDQSRSLARKGPITLVYSASDEVHNDAIALRHVIWDAVNKLASSPASGSWSPPPTGGVHPLYVVNCDDRPAPLMEEPDGGD